jgi:hypothetical protein
MAQWRVVLFGLDGALAQQLVGTTFEQSTLALAVAGEKLWLERNSRCGGLVRQTNGRAAWRQLSLSRIGNRTRPAT